jgi:hypothetical protein
VVQLYTQALSSLLVAYDLQGYGGGILTCLHLVRQFEVKVKVKVMLQLTGSQSVCFGAETTMELVIRYYFLSEICRVVSVRLPF